MERLSCDYEMSKEFLEGGYLNLEGYRNIISQGLAQEIVKKIHDKLEIKEENLKECNLVRYSTEFYLMKPEELKDINELLRKIYALTDNYFTHNNIKEISNMLNYVK